MARAPKRFIKKVPPSGGPPAFKLTLPHQVVHRHLLHLVDADFELAPSANAQQTWQGSIAPRRNKERSEYTLQGWKLFAEAHKVKAGDQVSFELISPHRMVIQIIRPLEAATASPESVQNPCKSLKLTESSSPGGSCDHQAMVRQEFALEPDLWLHSGILDDPTLEEGWPIFPAMPEQLSRGSDEGSSEMAEAQAQQEAAPTTSQGGQPMLHSQSISDSKFVPPASPSASQRVLPHHGSFANLSSAGAVSPVQSRKRSLSMANSIPVTGSAATLFSDLMQPPLDPPNTEAVDPPSPMLKEFFDAEDTDTSDAANQQPGSASHLNLQLGSLSTTIQSLQADVQRFEARADNAETEVNGMRTLYDQLQGSLDRQSRDALRAATGLEKTTNRLATPQLLASVDRQSAEVILGIQSDLFDCLTSLKGSLWQLLVLTLGETEQGAFPGNCQGRG